MLLKSPLAAAAKTAVEGWVILLLFFFFNYFFCAFFKKRYGDGGEKKGGGQNKLYHPLCQRQRKTNIGATIRISREILCLLYAGFFLSLFEDTAVIFLTLLKGNLVFFLALCWDIIVIFLPILQDTYSSLSTGTFELSSSVKILLSSSPFSFKIL